MTGLCAKCGAEKEPSRQRSRLCRTCDGGGKPRATVSDLEARLDRQAEAIRDLLKRVRTLEQK